MWHSCKRKKETQQGGLYWDQQHRQLWNHSIFANRALVSQLWGNISATRLFSPIRRRDKVQSMLWSLQRLVYSRRDRIWLSASFYKNNWHFCSKCQVIVSLFAYLQKESEVFTSLFPSVKCPFIAFHTLLLFCCLFLCLPSSQSLSHPLLSLPVEERSNADWTLQQRAPIAECAMISNPIANCRLTQKPQNKVCICEILEYLSIQACFYNPVIVPYLAGRIC